MVVRSRERHVLTITPSKTTFYPTDVPYLGLEFQHAAAGDPDSDQPVARCQHLPLNGDACPWTLGTFTSLHARRWHGEEVGERLL